MYYHQVPYITITDFKVQDNSAFINTSVKLVHTDTNKQYIIDVDVETKMQLENLKIQTLMEALVEGSTNRITFINHIIDYCKLFMHISPSWQLKLVMGDPTRFSNIPKTCPIKPGHYFVRNFTSDLKYFPMKVIPKMKFFTSFEIFTIIKKRKIITSLVKVYSELRYNNL